MDLWAPIQSKKPEIEDSSEYLTTGQIRYKIVLGISRISKKISGKKLRNLEKNISRFIVFELEIFINISNFLNLEILELFRDLKISKCL